MRLEGDLGVQMLLRNFRGRVLITWFLVLLENLLIALIPLFIGRAIDALLENQTDELWLTAFVMVVLIAVAVGRRVYDTRSYGTMRVHFGAELVERIKERPVSQVNARLDMGREMVDFLEEHVPELLTAVIQLVVSVIILWSIDLRIGISATVTLIGLGVLYAFFHPVFFRLNGKLNSQKEQQVAILDERDRTSLMGFLKKLRRCEVRLSDTEAVLFGLIYLGMFAFLLTNLWLASTISAITAGAIFIVLSYSWELVESGAVLPVVLQQWSRLSEIKARLNDPSMSS
ncbi:MAG: ABC transporter six-transmembrane domain-containing protein [Pseudomonadota bacterium]